VALHADSTYHCVACRARAALVILKHRNYCVDAKCTKMADKKQTDMLRQFDQVSL
jgi:hypothetical protein